MPHSFTKRGIFYFERRVPSDLKQHYSSGKICYSLRTKSAPVAASRAQRAAQRLDEYWYYLRVQDQDLPGKHLLRRKENMQVATVVASEPDSPSVTLSEAVGIYLRLKGAGRPLTFARAAELSCGYVIDACGDKDLTRYRKTDATAFWDALIAKGLTGSSITRIFGTVRAVINFAISEVGLEMTNPFTGVYYDRSQGVKERKPLSRKAVLRVQSQCRRHDDELRWLVALISDTGMRLAEAAGLKRDDIVLSSQIPHVVIRPHPWRRLKTRSSGRKVPLVGESLWAAHRILSAGPAWDYAFPRYTDGKVTNANSASAALNKWIKQQVKEGGTMHGFRHAMRDRLRAVECPSDVADQIGGWETDGVGQSYGQGYPLQVLRKWLQLGVEEL
ncbi:DUF6538 domain-containing protein [Pseudooceanicola sp. HF7]|uniref:DUF6538 domain-containing protein n=1 Tax=Pseudooceanicola sp. HF7 TaxID=2721560 RepID=UPI0034C5E113